MPAEFDSLVSKLKGKKGIRNAFAVARAKLGSNADIIARRDNRKRGRPKRKNGHPQPR